MSVKSSIQRAKKRKQREAVKVDADGVFKFRDVFAMNRKERRRYLAQLREQLREKARKEASK